MLKHEDTSRPKQETPSSRAVILGGLAGNVMEWYDFAVYGYFASVLAPLFFPSDDPASSLVAAFGAFAAGFLMRPLGGVVFGHIGDRVGRKAALTLSVMLMAVPSVLIGLLPTYAVIGWWAPAAMVALRMVQGLSVGGEYTSSIAFLVENAHRTTRGYMGCWASVGSVAGALLGSGVGAVINTVLPPEDMAAWGWRIPFLLGLGVAGTAVWLRKSLPDIELPEPEEGEASPVVAAVRTKSGAIIRTVGVLMVYAVGYYICFLYLTSFLIDRVKVPAYEALDINTISMAAMMLLIPSWAGFPTKWAEGPSLSARPWVWSCSRIRSSGSCTRGTGCRCFSASLFSPCSCPRTPQPTRPPWSNPFREKCGSAPCPSASTSPSPSLGAPCPWSRPGRRRCRTLRRGSPSGTARGQPAP